MKSRQARAAALAAAAVIGAAGLAGCAPLVVGGAMAGGALVAADRRTVGIQIEDQAIELRVSRTIAERVPREAANVSVTSYNRKVLLTGEATTEATRAQIGEIAARAENVRTVVNEVFVAPLTTLPQRNNDLAIAARLSAALLAGQDVPSSAVTTKTQRGIVYLMGRVSEAEGEAPARSASRVTGVQRVVKVFDYISAEEAAQFKRAPEAPPETTRKP
ncbi:MAG: BON domain-containing protein [Betaproteobacteria bacterium]